MSYLKITILTSFLFINSAFADAQKINPITELYMVHQDMASDKWMNYFDIYHNHFSNFVDHNPNVLEIGIQNGGSTQILAKYFKNANMYGIDIDKKVCEQQQLSTNVKTFCFDIKDTKEYQKNMHDIALDIVIDDGSHMPKDIIFAFEYLFEKVKPGGVYLVEDLHTSYWKSHNGGFRKEGTAIEYFKQLIDYLNYYGFEDQNKKATTPEIIKNYVQWIDYIVFYDSVLVIKKSLAPKTKGFDRIVVGTKQPVAPTIDAAKKDGYYVKPDIDKK